MAWAWVLTNPTTYPRKVKYESEDNVGILNWATIAEVASSHRIRQP